MKNRIHQFANIIRTGNKNYLEPYKVLNEGNLTFFAGFGWSVERTQSGLDTIISPDGKKYFVENLFLGETNDRSLRDARDLFELLFEDRLFYEEENRKKVFKN